MLRHSSAIFNGHRLRFLPARPRASLHGWRPFHSFVPQLCPINAYLPLLERLAACTHAPTHTRTHEHAVHFRDRRKCPFAFCGNAEWAPSHDRTDRKHTRPCACVCVCVGACTCAYAWNTCNDARDGFLEDCVDFNNNGIITIAINRHHRITANRIDELARFSPAMRRVVCVTRDALFADNGTSVHLESERKIMRFNADDVMSMREPIGAIDIVSFVGNLPLTALFRVASFPTGNRSTGKRHAMRAWIISQEEGEGRGVTLPSSQSLKQNDGMRRARSPKSGNRAVVAHHGRNHRPLRKP